MTQCLSKIAQRHFFAAKRGKRHIGWLSGISPNEWQNDFSRKVYFSAVWEYPILSRYENNDRIDRCAELLMTTFIMFELLEVNQKKFQHPIRPQILRILQSFGVIPIR